jgi:hypothetical protein
VFSGRVRYPRDRLWGPVYRPEREWRLWIAYWLLISAVSLIWFVFLWFPDGRLPPLCWRPVLARGRRHVLGAVRWFSTRGLLFEAENPQLAAYGQPVRVQETWILDVIEVVGFPLFILSVLAPVVTLFVRSRRSEGEGCQQIRGSPTRAECWPSLPWS